MSAERMSGLERRAAVHRALGDPGRLALIDALALGDASPTQLGRDLGMTSNLLAHHVDVLVDVGLVRRIRSEGDRRRSYLALIPGTLDGLVRSTKLRTERIVFVCTENAARSQLAAALWAARSDVPVASAGTHPAGRVHAGAIAVARRHGLPLSPTTPRHLDEVLEDEDLVITVCDRAHEELAAHRAGRHWSVADPARSGTDAAFDAALRELTGRVTQLAPELEPGPPQQDQPQTPQPDPV